MRVFAAACLSFFCCLFCTVPSYADDAAYEEELARQWKLMPRVPTVLSYPSPDAWQVYGLGRVPKLSTSKGGVGEAVLKLNVKAATPNPWDIGAVAATQVAVSEGDVVVAAFWARNTSLGRDKKESLLPVHLQQATEPYTQFGIANARLTKEWTVHYVHGTVPQSFGAGAINLALHLGVERQDLELGPVFLWSLGSGDLDENDLPWKAASVKELGSRADGQQLSPKELNARLETDLDKTRAQVPYEAILINNPDVSVANAFGDYKSAKHVNDAGVPGGKAFEVQVENPGLNSWSAGINWPTHTGINKGETVLLAYWARAVDVHNEAQTGTISAARVQQSGEPFDSAANQAASIDKTWRMYYAQGTSGSPIEPGASGISFHLGLAKQTVRIGPAYILNYGAGVDPQMLPRTRLTYQGMEADAPWRQKALVNIDQYRKADLEIRVVDVAGNPIQGVKVDVEMTKHAFNFGTFVGHEFVKENGQKNDTYHQSFHKNFNMATAPLYWQDWGWNGGFKGNYRETVKYLHNNQINWRGHPIIWPGENYMPSDIKAEKGNTGKQRKMVLDHVRDVMGFVKGYDPIAVDMVNEVRVNQYFIDSGDPGLIKDAFKLAHEVAPDIPLFVNDYGILNSGGLNAKSIEFYHRWIKDMLAVDIPLGGIGFQAHFGAGLTPPARVIEILDGFGQYNLPLHITEFDVDTLDEQAQAAYTRDFLIAAFSQPNVEAFVIWGWWEGDHWKPSAAMLRQDWSERPSYAAWHDLVNGKWWTRESLVTDANGTVRLRGFKGDYDITIAGETTYQSLTTNSSVTLSR